MDKVAGGILGKTGAGQLSQKTAIGKVGAEHPVSKGMYEDDKKKKRKPKPTQEKSLLTQTVPDGQL